MNFSNRAMTPLLSSIQLPVIFSSERPHTHTHTRTHTHTHTHTRTRTHTHTHTHTQTHTHTKTTHTKNNNDDNNNNNRKLEKAMKSFFPFQNNPSIHVWLFSFNLFKIVHDDDDIVEEKQNDGLVTVSPCRTRTLVMLVQISSRKSLEDRLC